MVLAAVGKEGPPALALEGSRFGRSAALSLENKPARQSSLHVASRCSRFSRENLAGEPSSAIQKKGAATEVAADPLGRSLRVE